MNIGQFDQAIAAMADLAIAMAKYRDELIKQGFTRAEALYMSANLQASMFNTNK